MIPIVDKGESRELFKWVKASEELPPVGYDLSVLMIGTPAIARYWDNDEPRFRINYERNIYKANFHLIEWLKPIPQSSLKEDSKIVVWKDGTYKVTEGQTWEYENDENWLTTIKI